MHLSSHGKKCSKPPKTILRPRCSRPTQASTKSNRSFSLKEPRWLYCREAGQRSLACFVMSRQLDRPRSGFEPNLTLRSIPFPLSLTPGRNVLTFRDRLLTEACDFRYSFILC